MNQNEQMSGVQGAGMNTPIDIRVYRFHPDHPDWECVAQVGDWFLHKQTTERVRTVKIVDGAVISCSFRNIPVTAEARLPEPPKKNQKWYQQFDKRKWK